MKLNKFDWILIVIVGITMPLYGLGLILLGIFLWRLGCRMEKEAKSETEQIKKELWKIERQLEIMAKMESDVKFYYMKDYAAETLEELR